MQVEVMLSKLPAIVTGANGHDSFAGRCPQGYGHRVRNGFLTHAVDHDFQRAMGAFVQLAFDSTTQCGAETLRRGSLEVFVA